jgi:hypothetical protein
MTAAHTGFCMTVRKRKALADAGVANCSREAADAAP